MEVSYGDLQFIKRDRVEVVFVQEADSAASGDDTCVLSGASST
jgi:hypothetical protein